MATKHSNVIQFPVKHGPITEHEWGVRCVQQACQEVFGRAIDSASAREMAEIVIRRKRRKQVSDATGKTNG